MPEGDTIYRAAQRLHRVLIGRTIQSVEGSDIIPLAGSLLGSVVKDIESRGKHLLIHFSHSQVLHSHLGMSGSWQIYRKGENWRKPKWQAALMLVTADHCVVCFQPKCIELVSDLELRRNAWLQHLGPDLLGESTPPEVIVARFRTQNGVSIGEALLNQTVVSGIGNVYKSEVLFLEQLDPQVHVSALTDEQIASLVSTATRLLRRNLTAEKRRTRFRATGPAVWVYGRNGEPCLKCGSTVRMVRQGNMARSTYYCPGCQGIQQAATRP
ncbi:MAG: DNA-formamidopyrimidine glycosylase family protein [Planctomycetaceae bacterium]|jgi:endonuclease-8